VVYLLVFVAFSWSCFYVVNKRAFIFCFLAISYCLPVERAGYHDRFCVGSDQIYCC